MSPKSDALTVWNIINLANPVLAGKVIDSDYLDGADNIFVLEGYAYVTSDLSLIVWDVSSHSDPIFKGGVS